MVDIEIPRRRAVGYLQRRCLKRRGNQQLVRLWRIETEKLNNMIPTRASVIFYRICEEGDIIVWGKGIAEIIEE